MLFNLRPLQPYYGTTTPIRLPDDDGATGFYFNHNGVSYLVTNKHVLESYDRCPPDMAIYFRDIDPSKYRRHSIGDVSDREWYSHPMDQKVDIAIIPLYTHVGTLGESSNTEGPGSRAFTQKHFLHEDITLTDSPSILCYPGNFIDSSTYFPIKRNAKIASPYGWQFNGRQHFLTDAQMHPGSSGSPIVQTDLLAFKGSGHNVPDDRKRGTYLLGIHSATFYGAGIEESKVPEDLKYELNVAWYPQFILEIIALHSMRH